MKTKKIKIKFILFLIIAISIFSLLLNTKTQKTLKTSATKVLNTFLQQGQTLGSWDISEKNSGDITATLYEDGRLVISGTGKMKAWDSTEKTEYHATEFIEKIKKVIIEDGVETIGKYAFANCINLTDIEIPESTTKIGVSEGIEIEVEGVSSSDQNSVIYSSFMNCKKLENINVNSNNEKYSSVEGVLFNKTQTEIEYYPEGKKQTNYIIPRTVTTIKQYAFKNAINLTNITIQEGVETIAPSAFENCIGITKIEIPDSARYLGETLDINHHVINIGQSLPFIGCEKLQEIIVNESNTKYSSQNGILFNKEKTEILCYPQGKTEVTYTIPSEIKNIGVACFLDCKYLKNIEIPEGVTNIGLNAFENCTGLVNIHIPQSVTNIIYTGDDSTTFLAPLLVFYPFIQCANLKAITVEPDNPMYSSEEGVLFNKDKTEILYYPEGKQEKIYVIPNNVTAMASYMFLNNTNLEKIVIPNSEIDIARIFLVKLKKHMRVITDMIGNSESLNVTLYCKKDSAAEQYAAGHDMAYVVDENNPRIDSVNKSPSSWTKESVTITINATDNESEIATTNGYSFDNGDTWQTENSKTYSQNTNEIRIKVKDNLGNIATYGETINIDKIDNDNPTINTVTGNVQNWTKDDVTLTVDATDSGSGIATTNAYSFDNGDTWQTENKKTYQENKKEIIVKVKDEAGNIATYGQIINIDKIDKTVPTITITPNSSSKTKTKEVTITVQDEGGSELSEENSYQYYLSTSNTQLEGGQWEDYETGKAFTIGSGITGTRYLWVKQVADKAGNKSQGSYMISGEFVFDNTSAPEEPLMGDINGDKRINISDLLLLKRHVIAGSKENWKLTGERLERANINKDENINISDILLLKRLVLRNM